MIIGIAGAARSGKDTLAMKMVEDYGFTQDSFAAPIRSVIRQILGLTPLELEEIKDYPHPVLGNKSPRYAMQTLGTEWGRNMITPDLWVNSFIHRNRSQERVVVSDVRFDNEAQAILSMGGKVIKVSRPGKSIGTEHASEKGISDHLIHAFFDNNGTKEDLFMNLYHYLGEMDLL